MQRSGHASAGVSRAGSRFPRPAAGTTSRLNITGGLIPTGINFPISGTLEIHLKPGSVTNVSMLLLLMAFTYVS